MGSRRSDSTGADAGASPPGNDPPTRDEILACLREAAVPLPPAEVATRLGVEGFALEPFHRRLRAMERDGQLMPNRKGMLLLASKIDLRAGRVQGHRDGFGFFIADEGGPDMFLSPRQMQKAMHGDRVLVRQTGLDSRGRPEAVIVEVTDRGHRRLVGRLLSERGVHIVVPEDQRIKHDILIPPADLRHAQHGQVVTCEIVEPPTGHAPPIGRVVEILGEIGDPGMEIEIAVRKFDVPHVFGEDVLAEAQSLPAAVRPTDLPGRVDLRDIPLVTIDGADARDFDDAVYCEPMQTGRGNSRRVSGYRLIVAIADVGHYVTPGSALDDEAAQRTTSVYFPRRVIPMLPEKLSNGLCSLNPQVDRLVLVCDMTLSAEGEVRGYQFYDAVMRSVARLTYDEVWSVLSGSGARSRTAVGEGSAGDELREHLLNLHDLYRVMARAREARGAMDFDTVETRIVCDPAGRIERIEPMVRNDAHRLIEECMLAANVCAADFMSRGKHPGLFRVHEGPTPEKLALLREFLRTIGMTLGGGEEPSPRDYAELAVLVRARPDAPLVQTMMLRSMQQALYTPENEGHFGLAYPAYAHFTSPIRRYPDLLTHRVIKALLAHRRYRLSPPKGTNVPIRARTKRPGALAQPAAPASALLERERAAFELWQQYGARCSANERRADEASRDVEAWLKCQYMRDRVGEQFVGRITGVAPFGVFVTLNELYVEGLVHVSELGEEYFQFSDAAHELRGERTGLRFRLTDEIEVQVSRVDLEARRIEFRLVPRTGYRELVREPSREAAGANRGKRAAKPKPGSAATPAQAPEPTRGAGKRVKGATSGTVKAARKTAPSKRGSARMTGKRSERSAAKPARKRTKGTR